MLGRYVIICLVRHEQAPLERKEPKMTQPTIAKATLHTIVSGRTWKLVGTTWLVFMAGFAIVAVFGIAAGARIEAAIDYLWQMTGLCFCSSLVSCVAFCTYFAYKRAMHHWRIQQRTRRTFRRSRHSVR
jgi:hypothetical protein